MAITKITKDLDEETFFKTGGIIEFEVDAIDIDSTGTGFEEVSGIKENLYTGFEIKPPDIISGVEESYYIHKDDGLWTRIIHSVYIKKGKIIYAKLSNGRYRATCHLKF
ncbi:hypothetical protein [Xenorhabdus bovienii]|uniref:Uncharacterized protein n=1 Tax=Xenorhabdus bovienii str. kraussei Becker Underwood TaxID=1398204 RepID=A0A077PP84_XENBV|nr:hypothetical protein [Xenorhabdus bovienii]CDH22407.1 hypothetical protein XBKB1_1140006 [Xenorhabdus bovienii str. kraussei Becker Underwood]